VSEAILDDLAADSALWPAGEGYATMTMPVPIEDGFIRDPARGEPLPQIDRLCPTADGSAGLVVLGLAAGLWARGGAATDPRKRRAGYLFSSKKTASGAGSTA
jgi:hypothetical protein